MAERMVKANGIDVWCEDFGDPADPTILLVMGATAQGILWPEDFCELLVQGGRHVIRYDNRDTGQSTCRDYAEHPYTVSDMAADAIGVLDAFGVDAAHVVGASMGGMIGQALAIEHPGRVLTLTSMMSSPGGAAVAEALSVDGSGAPAALPPPEQKVIDVMMARMAEPPVTRQQRLDAAVEMWRALSGTTDAFDEAAVRAREERALDRASNPDASMNHSFAVASSPDRTEALGQVTTPTLVIHGTADPILPFGHGEATAKAIPGAQLMAIEGMGHDLPPSVLEPIATAILTHTA